MPTTLTRVAIVHKTGSPDVTAPNLGWVGSSAAKLNDFVTIASGVVQQAVAVSTTIADATRVAIIPIPVASTVAANTVVPIEKLDDDNLLEIPIADSSAGSVATPGAATNLTTLVGNQYGISRDSNGVYYLNKAITTTSSLKGEIVALGSVYPVTDNFATVLVRILPGARLN